MHTPPLKHLLSCRDLDADLILQLIQTANQYLSHHPHPAWHQKTICLFFVEDSTRTRCSFEIAAQKIQANVIHFDWQRSSLNKNETYLDTFANLAEMGVNLFVIRHKEELFSQKIAAGLTANAAIINAGDGCHEHPTQALLDVMTIQQNFSDWEKLKVAIVGDIIHSRVAHSLCHLLLSLEVADIRLIGPKEWLPETQIHPKHVQCLTDCRQGLKEVDVIVTLRIQKERLEKEMQMCDQDYFSQYGIDTHKLKLAHQNAIVMHPGPMNRGIEIASEVADGKQSRILTQVRNGVLMRMAIMDYLFRRQS